MILTPAQKRFARLSAEERARLITNRRTKGMAFMLDSTDEYRQKYDAAYAEVLPLSAQEQIRNCHR